MERFISGGDMAVVEAENDRRRGFACSVKFLQGEKFRYHHELERSQRRWPCILS